MKLLLAFVAALKLLASCVPPVDRLPLPPPLPQTYRSGTTDPSSLGDEHWQQLFLDPQLRSLVGTALVNNAGINIEVQRVYAAEAVLGQITARQRPNVSIDLSASYQRINGPQGGGVSSSETITPTLLATTASPYDVDLFGALRYATAAQRARLLASDASRQAVITRVVGDAALVPSLLQTLGDGGFKRSTVKFDRAQRELDLYAYLRTIQTAMQGVANGLLDYARQREAVAQQILLTASTRQYASLANLRYTGGVGSYIDVLDGESRYFTAEITLAQTQLAERLAELNLYAALGGGWQDAPLAASAGSPIPALSAPPR